MATTALPDSTLHVHVGLLIFFGTALLLRGKVTSLWPLVAVTVAELFNECMDAAFFGSWHWSDTGSDVFHTLVWPILLSMGAVIFRTRATPDSRVRLGLAVGTRPRLLTVKALFHSLRVARRHELVNKPGKSI